MGNLYMKHLQISYFGDFSPYMNNLLHLLPIVKTSKYLAIPLSTLATACKMKVG